MQKGEEIVGRLTIKVNGVEDDLAEAMVDEEGLTLSSPFSTDVVAIPWESLAILLVHPTVQGHLEVADLMREKI